MAPLAKALVAIIAIALLANTAISTNFTVGGLNAKWDLDNDYKAWAESLTFHPKDSIIFNYDDTEHDVAEVTKENFEKCNGLNPIALDMSGVTIFQLTVPETRYFICTVPLHCSTSGMKVEIKVVSRMSPGMGYSPEGIPSEVVPSPPSPSPDVGDEPADYDGPPYEGAPMAYYYSAVSRIDINTFAFIFIGLLMVVAF